MQEYIINNGDDVMKYKTLRFKWVFLYTHVTYRLYNRIGGRCFVDSLLALWGNDRQKIEKLTDEDILYSINTVKTK